MCFCCFGQPNGWRVYLGWQQTVTKRQQHQSSTLAIHFWTKSNREQAGTLTTREIANTTNDGGLAAINWGSHLGDDTESNTFWLLHIGNRVGSHMFDSEQNSQERLVTRYVQRCSRLCIFIQQPHKRYGEICAGNTTEELAAWRCSWDTSDPTTGCIQPAHNKWSTKNLQVAQAAGFFHQKAVHVCNQSQYPNILKSKSTDRCSPLWKRISSATSKHRPAQLRQGTRNPVSAVTSATVSKDSFPRAPRIGTSAMVVFHHQTWILHWCRACYTCWMTGRRRNTKNKNNKLYRFHISWYRYTWIPHFPQWSNLHRDSHGDPKNEIQNHPNQPNHPKPFPCHWSMLKFKHQLSQPAWVWITTSWGFW